MYADNTFFVFIVLRIKTTEFTGSNPLAGNTCGVLEQVSYMHFFNLSF